MQKNTHHWFEKIMNAFLSLHACFIWLKCSVVEKKTKNLHVSSFFCYIFYDFSQFIGNYLFFFLHKFWKWTSSNYDGWTWTMINTEYELWLSIKNIKLQSDTWQPFELTMLHSNDTFAILLHCMSYSQYNRNAWVSCKIGIDDFLLSI